MGVDYSYIDFLSDNPDIDKKCTLVAKSNCDRISILLFFLFYITVNSFFLYQSIIDIEASRHLFKNSSFLKYQSLTSDIQGIRR
jgi:hypothetical protein